MTAEPHGRHRTPEEIRAALKADRTSLKTVRDALSAEDQEAFDHAYWHAIDKVKLSYDLKPVFEFQKRWWWTAYEKADPAEYADTIARAERAMEYLERGEMPPGAVMVDDVYKQRMRERIEPASRGVRSRLGPAGRAGARRTAVRGRRRVHGTACDAGGCPLGRQVLP